MRVKVKVKVRESEDESDDDEFNQHFAHLSKKDKLMVLKLIEKFKSKKKHFTSKKSFSSIR